MNVLAELRTGLCQALANCRRSCATIHVGPVTTDPEGISGHAIDQTARFIEAPAFKKQIAVTTADLGLATSEFVYDTVISQQAKFADLAEFRKMKFRMKKSRKVAWTYLSNTIEDPDHL